MKRILISFLSLAMLIFMAGCGEDTTAGISRITSFADFTVDGGLDDVVVSVGSDYSAPTAVATENGKSLDVTTTISSVINGLSTFDINTVDQYIFTYSAVNSDGYPGSVSKNVFVVNTGDFVTSIEGLYTSTVVRNDVSDGQYTDMGYIFVTMEGGDFVISDYIGGYYDLGRGYGPAYAATGPTITVNNIATSDVTINGNDFGVGAFGGSAVISDFNIDVANKQISFNTDWDAGYLFAVTLTQVQP
jgi:hypothetical protein